MAYEKQTFTDWEYDASGNVVKEGTTLQAAHLKHIEDGIGALETAQGNLDELETENKDSLVKAVNEAAKGTKVTGFAVTETDTAVTMVLETEKGSHTHVLGFDENGNPTSITVDGVAIPGTWEVAASE